MTVWIYSPPKVLFKSVNEQRNQKEQRDKGDSYSCTTLRHGSRNWHSAHTHKQTHSLSLVYTSLHWQECWRNGQNDEMPEGEAKPLQMNWVKEEVEVEEEKEEKNSPPRGNIVSTHSLVKWCCGWITIPLNIPISTEWPRVLCIWSVSTGLNKFWNTLELTPKATFFEGDFYSFLEFVVEVWCRGALTWSLFVWLQSVNYKMCQMLIKV